MRKKYKTEPDLETGLLRIIALKDFSDVKKGDKGGLIEKEENLSQEGDCWVYYHARVSGNACVYENAMVGGSAQIYGHAEVCGEAWVGGSAQIYGHAEVFGEAWVGGSAKVSGNARICGKIKVCGNTKVCGNVKLWSTDYIYINLPIKDSKDYVTLGITAENLKFRPWSSNTEDYKDWLPSVEENYLKNIQTIRQLYEKV